MIVQADRKDQTRRDDCRRDLSRLAGSEEMRIAFLGLLGSANMFHKMGLDGMATGVLNVAVRSCLRLRYCYCKGSLRARGLRPIEYATKLREFDGMSRDTYDELAALLRAVNQDMPKHVESLMSVVRELMGPMIEDPEQTNGRRSLGRAVVVKKPR